MAEHRPLPPPEPPRRKGGARRAHDPRVVITMDVGRSGSITSVQDVYDMIDAGWKLWFVPSDDTWTLKRDRESLIVERGVLPNPFQPLLKVLARIAAERVHGNLQRYPDIVDENDPRLLKPLPSRAPPPSAQWVYFMADGDTGLIKVGTSIEVKARRATVSRKVGRKLAVAGTVRGGYATEAAFHRLLVQHWSHGEWFRRGPWFDQVLAGLDAGEDADALLQRLKALDKGDG